MLQTLKS